MWTKFTNEVINGLWNNWRDYYHRREAAISEVYDAACNSYLDYANACYVDTDEDFEYGERWLDDRYEEVKEWADECIRKLDAEIEPFKKFLRQLSELKFYDSYVGYTLIVYFYEMKWEYVKATDPSEAKKFNVHFKTMHHWYKWEGVIERTVDYKVVKPQFVPWQK